VNSTDNDRMTALHVAAQEGGADCVRVLVDNGADVAAMSRHGDSPLAMAARYGRLACLVSISCRIVWASIVECYS